MKIPKPTVDYRSFRPSKLNTDEFRHLKLLIYWPVFGILFFMLEKVIPWDYYYPMHCSFDDLIPFNEWFVFPYIFWFVYLIGIHVYTLLYDIPAFKRLMCFIILTYSAALVIYIMFPNCQNMRPAEFERDNILTRFMADYYSFDTHTNVCPSLHVIGSVAVMTCALNMECFKTPLWRTFFICVTVLISISTVFLKQHSVMDIVAALPICFMAYFPAYVELPSRKRLRPE